MNAHSITTKNGATCTRNSEAHQYTHVVLVSDINPEINGGAWRWSRSKASAEKYARSIDGKHILDGARAYAIVVELTDGHRDLRDDAPVTLRPVEPTPTSATVQEVPVSIPAKWHDDTPTLATELGCTLDEAKALRITLTELSGKALRERGDRAARWEMNRRKAKRAAKRAAKAQG